MSSRKSRIENLGSGAASASTSFFVLAPTISCILSPIIDATESIAEDVTERRVLLQRQRREQAKRKQRLQHCPTPGRASPSSTSLAPQPPAPTWIGSLIALGYEIESEHLSLHQQSQASLDESLFPLLELMEEEFASAVTKQRTQARLVSSSVPTAAAAESFWAARIKKNVKQSAHDDDSDDDDSFDECEAADADEEDEAMPRELEMRCDKTAVTLPEGADHLAAPSVFEKHLDNFRRRHHIEVPNLGGADALQLRGGKSSVIAWAQRELHAYRQQATQTQLRIKRTRKEANRILAQTEMSPASQQQHQQQQHGTLSFRAISSDPTTMAPNHEVNNDVMFAGSNSHVQMLRRIVASKSVLALQAQATVPASESEAATWTHRVPPRPASAILSVLAERGDQSSDPDEAELRSEIRRRGMVNGGGISPRSSRNHRPLSAAVQRVPPAAKAISQQQQQRRFSHEGEADDEQVRLVGVSKKKKKADQDPLERLLMDRMELLLGGVSPGVIVAETTEPHHHSQHHVSEQSKAELRAERRARAEITRQQNLGVVGRAKEAAKRKLQLRGSSLSSSSPPKNTSELDPHKPEPPQVLVQKTPGQRKKILLEEMQRQQNLQKELLRRNSQDTSAQNNNNSSSALYMSITSPGVSAIMGKGNDNQSRLHEGDASAASDPPERPKHDERPGTAQQKKPALLSRVPRQLHAPKQPELWDFSHRMHTAGDVAHWNIVQQLAVKVMQQPRPTPEETEQEHEKQRKAGAAKAKQREFESQSPKRLCPPFL